MRIKMESAITVIIEDEIYGDVTLGKTDDEEEAQTMFDRGEIALEIIEDLMGLHNVATSASDLSNIYDILERKYG